MLISHLSRWIYAFIRMGCCRNENPSSSVNEELSRRLRLLSITMRLLSVLRIVNFRSVHHDATSVTPFPLQLVWLAGVASLFGLRATWNLRVNAPAICNNGSNGKHMFRLQPRHIIFISPVIHHSFSEQSTNVSYFHALSLCCWFFISLFLFL